MLSADEHLTHHLPPSFTVCVPVRKYLDEISGTVSPAKPDRVHPVMWEVANPKELVNIALV
jgi:hypothetical protein